MVERYFDHIIGEELNLFTTHPQNLAELIFEKQASRSEDSYIILSHDDTRYLEISLNQFRFVIFSLYKQFVIKQISPGSTVLLASVTGNNELFIALTFAALTSFGVRVLLPMFMETRDLVGWLKESDCHIALIPEEDILALHHHDKEKRIVKEIRRISTAWELSCYDIFSDLKIREYLYSTPPDFSYCDDDLYRDIVRQTSLQTESLLISTSGSTGKSKLVTYCQKAHIYSCMSWQQVGLFDEALLGGRCFTPMFTHTMGIRAFFNAMWTGSPVCIINTEWFLEKPETVRYLLLKMLPEHITGGPSIYNLFLELMRCFPELKKELLRSLKTLISSGAPIDRETLKQIESSFGLKIYNAFGTTETQQILNSLLLGRSGKLERTSLGAPLPGVKIGLKRLRGEQDLYELYVASSFGMKLVLEPGDQIGAPPGYFRTGDIVRFDDDNLIFYAGRDTKDFIKDGFGVKIPVRRLKKHYERLFAKAMHIEFFPVKGVPGLAALVFIRCFDCEEGIVSDEKLIREYSGVISEVNNRLAKTLEPFEYRHRSIIRFTLVNSEPPKTVKGNVSGFKIRSLYEDELTNLVEPLGCSEFVKNIEILEHHESLFSHHHNSYFGKMLLSLAIDYTYYKSKKDSLFTVHRGKELEILDFTGGFGVNLLGHNNERINQAAIEFIQNSEIAISDQGSIQKYPGELAEKLNLIVGDLTRKDYNVVFGSTGSEAVEVAMHHAFLEWKGSFERIRKIQFEWYGSDARDLVHEVWEKNAAKLSNSEVSVLCLKDAFHGHTSTARAVLGNTRKREKFDNILSVKAIFIDDRGKDWKRNVELAVRRSKIKLQKIVCQGNSYVEVDFYFPLIIAAIAEPIIGEGGIRAVNTEFLKCLSEYDFPLIMDEIQSGLGRSGSFLASEGVNASYYLFAKALGGNIEKISAVLIEKSRYVKEFPDFYSSTFANGGLAAKVALETLKIIEEEDVARKSGEKGKTIAEELNAIREEYPGVIQEITGKGLMQGIRFCDFSGSDQVFFRCLYNENYLGLLFSAYLLLKHRIRILPSISSPNVLRIEPSVCITEDEIDKLGVAFRELCGHVANSRIYEIFKPLMDDDPFTDNKGRLPDEGFMFTGLEEPLPGAEKVAIIAHFVYPNAELRTISQDLCQASDTGLRILFNRFQTLMQAKAFRLFSKNIMQGKVHFTFIALAVDSAELDKLIRQKKKGKMNEKIQEAVNLANELGVKTVSLGAYTSIISNNGLSLVEPKGMRIVTGNTLTAASGIRRLKSAIAERNGSLGSTTLGIVGASGNIGSILTQSLAQSEVDFEQVYLFGRNTKKLEKTIAEIQNGNRSRMKIASDLRELKKCNVIIVATNTNDPIIFPHHINSGADVVISDLSVPRSVSEEVCEMKNVVSVNFASYIRLPNEPELVISSHTPKGTVFCCAAEAILNGLHPIDCELKGKISLDGVRKVTELAEQYQFFDQLRAAEIPNMI